MKKVFVAAAKGAYVEVVSLRSELLAELLSFVVLVLPHET